MIAGVGAGGLTLALAACGGGDNTSAAQPSADASQSSAPAGGGALGKTSDIPVGGGTVFKDQKVVVVQPTSGEFKAFSAVCTHQGCSVASVANGTIDCPCHGSKFKIEDGSVTAGPAKDPLPEQQIKVDGDQITLA
ncbi:Rieske (2Fe-2S) protein [Nonomuraea rhizosphaerae]|uniref:Rieske (2Fe-2S) protein n=1 Tax=Nonomuraea rhizosphaerae TaxID=2665663 RepID=UPI0027E39A7B|nr:Rieske (2Fe-2S) protein [Nonomuraea rhizosphaerae]